MDRGLLGVLGEVFGTLALGTNIKYLRQIQFKGVESLLRILKYLAEAYLPQFTHRSVIQ